MLNKTLIKSGNAGLAPFCLHQRASDCDGHFAATAGAIQRTSASGSPANPGPPALWFRRGNEASEPRPTAPAHGTVRLAEPSRVLSSTHRFLRGAPSPGRGPRRSAYPGSKEVAEIQRRARQFLALSRKRPSDPSSLQRTLIESLGSFTAESSLHEAAAARQVPTFFDLIRPEGRSFAQGQRAARQSQCVDHQMAEWRARHRPPQTIPPETGLRFENRRWLRVHLGARSVPRTAAKPDGGPDMPQN
jgi:hypothetical protein